jgi:hypothetical protein
MWGEGYTTGVLIKKESGGVMATKNKTPDIKFENGKMSITGRSIPYNSSSIYQPFIDQFFDYSKKPLQITEINIQLDFINSDSTRSLMNLFVMVERLFHRGHSVKVNWYYAANNTEILEQGSILNALVDFPVEFIPVSAAR